MSIFSKVATPRIKRSLFNLSHTKKLSCDLGTLIPILCEEIVPGDTWSHQSKFFMRWAPMLAPIMHDVDVYTHYFFVPNRLIWDEWQEFITAGAHGDDFPIHPRFNLNDPAYKYLLTEGSMLDYLGYPIPDKFNPADQSNEFYVSSLPLRAVGLCWNEYFRDQNLSDPLDIYMGSGMENPDTFQELLRLRNRCWEKDYFTSSLPTPQRGKDVHLPMTGDAPVSGNMLIDSPVAMGGLQVGHSSALDSYAVLDSQKAIVKAKEHPQGLSADMSKVTSATINDLRQASALQRFLEVMNVGGSRYIEQIAAMFGVRSSDARLQRPEFLGGTADPVVISEVLQNSGSTDVSPQGNMAGHAVGVGKTKGFRKFFEEHGFIIGFMSIRPRSSYQQGVRKSLFRFDYLDYYFPMFAHLGEQEVKNKEVFAEFADPVYREQTFGYQSRYSEYKFIPNTVHGQFKTKLSFWHMGRIFEKRPSLNRDFVTVDQSQFARNFTVIDPNSERVYVELLHNIKAKRPMPKFVVPRLG